MKNNTKISIVLITILLLSVTTYGLIQYNTFFNHDEHKIGQKKGVTSPYVGQENRTIKALPSEDIKGLKKGSGTPFGGMAKPAELNGYPGPKHVLDADEENLINLSEEQREKIEELYQEMKTKAIRIGKELLKVEKRLDEEFKNKTITKESLKNRTEKSAILYGKLRSTHLEYHLSVTSILNSSQIKRYNKVRGYNGDPCENIPEGHDPKVWKKHNNC